MKTDRHLQHTDVNALLPELIVRYGRSRAMCSDNGSELLARALQDDMKRQNRQLDIEPGKLCQTGNNELFFDVAFRTCLNATICANLMEARAVLEQWRRRTISVARAAKAIT